MIFPDAVSNDMANFVIKDQGMYKWYLYLVHNHYMQNIRREHFDVEMSGK